jgi:ABC-type transport system involved in multi-copper enzyme maturation permease subunit
MISIEVVNRMRQIIAIAQNTFREAIRDRILYGFLFFAISLILFSLVLGQLSFHEEVRVTIDVGLAGISIFSVLMAIFLSITLLHKEIEKKTLYTVLSRPVSRGSYLVGKFLGLVSTIAVQMLLMVLVWVCVLLLQGGTIGGGLIAAVFLMFCEVVLIIAIALFFTSFSSPLLSGLFCFGIFASGRNAQILEVLAKNKSMAAFEPFFNGLTAVLPNFYLFFPSGKMIDGTWATVHAQFVSSGYLLWACGYSFAYTAVFLLLAIVLLSRRDFV